MQWPVSLKFGPDGALYYAAWNTDDIRKIQFIGEAGAGGRVPPDLLISKSEISEGQIVLHWNPSCNAGDTNYAIFYGPIPIFDVVNPVLCSTAGGTAKSIQPDAESSFYLVVPHNNFWQGSFGQDSAGDERTATGSVCFSQVVTPCN
jgi:hypothetical protein